MQTSTEYRPSIAETIKYVAHRVHRLIAKSEMFESTWFLSIYWDLQI